MKKDFSFCASKIVSYDEVKEILELLDTLKKDGTLSQHVEPSFKITDKCERREIDCTLTTNTYEEFSKVHEIFFESNI